MKNPKSPTPESGTELAVPAGSQPPKAPPPPVDIPGTVETANLPGLADPLPAPEGVNAVIVTGVRVRALRPHDRHNGDRHPAGAEFVMCPEAAELSAARGDIEILSFNEEVQQ